MSYTRSSSTRRAGGDTRRWHHRVLAGSAVVALAVGGTVIAATASTERHAASQLQSVTAGPYRGMLANSKAVSLYVLSAESAGKLHCTAALCLKAWPPLLVRSATKSVSLGKGVKGRTGFLRRSSTMKQVTFNGYPVYRFSGDTGARQSNGEGIVADGGTWTLASASATTTVSTPVKPKALLLSVGASPYVNVLGTAGSLSLYALSNESAGKLHCTGACLPIWPPLVVPTAITSVSLGAGVKGTIGFVTRTASSKQVTFNGFPVYVYSGDGGPGQSSGEGIVADGGTWELVSAAATTTGTTQIPPAAPNPTTTTTYHY